MKENQQTALGIDIGGSHITAGLVDLCNRQIIETSLLRKKVNRHAPATEILDVWAATMNEILALHPGSFSSVGFAMPGPFDYENGICLIRGFDKYESLYGMDIRAEMAARTSIKAERIQFRNDADAFLEGEVFCGAAQGFSRAVGLTLGTGLGSCVYEDGRITNALPNEWPYKEGIAEDYISTRWFEKKYLSYTGKQPNGAQEIAAAYNHDEHARAIFHEFSCSLAVLLNHCINSFKPEVIVLGGNITNAFDLFIDTVKDQLQNHPQLPLFRKALLNEHAALIGAASRFEEKLSVVNA